MACRSGYIAVPALLVGSFFLAPTDGRSQIIGLPGQYPGGQYPGGQPGRYPGGAGGGPVGRRQSKTETTKEEQARTSTIEGILRRISSSDLVIQADDKRIVTVSLANTTKYLKASGSSAKTSDFGPGDHIRIDATQDDNGYYHATNVTLLKQGNAEEQVAASEPVDASPLADGVKSNAGGGGDDGPPRLRRNDSSSDSASNASGRSSDDGPPRIRRSPSSDSSSASEASDRTVKPQITRGDSADDAQAPRAVARTSEPDTPVPPDPDEPGPPKLRRGRPAAGSRNSDAPVDVARNEPPATRPSLHAQDVNGVTKAPAPPQIDTSAKGVERGADRGPVQSSGDSTIDKARQAAFSFTETLPDYIVKQFTTRYQTDAAHGKATSWGVVDTVTADVVSEGGKDTYKNILINGKPPKESVEKSGSWSTGEFSSVLLDVLSPATDADFHNRRSTTIVNRQAFRYDFSVDQENSHWHVYSAADSYQPAYTGAIWIDKDTSRVLRIEMAAQSMPRGFPLDTVESAVDYDFVMIGETKFLLPVHSETLSCERGTRICSRNVIDFRNYKKFGADTSITFDSTGK